MLSRNPRPSAVVIARRDRSDRDSLPHRNRWDSKSPTSRHSQAFGDVRSTYCPRLAGLIERCYGGYIDVNQAGANRSRKQAVQLRQAGNRKKLQSCSAPDGTIRTISLAPNNVQLSRNFWISGRRMTVWVERGLFGRRPSCSRR